MRVISSILRADIKDPIAATPTPHRISVEIPIPLRNYQGGKWERNANRKIESKLTGPAVGGLAKTITGISPNASTTWDKDNNANKEEINKTEKKIWVRDNTNKSIGT